MNVRFSQRILGHSTPPGILQIDIATRYKRSRSWLSLKPLATDLGLFSLTKCLTSTLGFDQLRRHLAIQEVGSRLVPSRLFGSLVSGISRIVSGTYESLPGVTMVNYDELDRTLDDIEDSILPLASQYRLKQANIERWRWDEPVITITWVGSDSISRNIHALIIERDSSTYELVVDINAWQDKDQDEGKMRVRSWHHEEVGRVPLPVDPPRLREVLNTGYSKVSNWSTGNLKTQTPLASGTVGP